MSNSLQKPLTLAVGVLAVLMAAQWWSANNEIRTLREEMANRLRTTDVTTTETRVIATTVQERTKELITKFSVLENKQAEAQNQQLALEQLYQDLSKNRDDWALAEIEQVLSTASQQLQLAGNVQGALIALQNADRTLSRSDKPQFISIRRVIAKDTEKLKSLPNLDLPGLALRLDSVISQIDNLPLVSDEKPAQISLPPKKPVIQAAPKVASAKGTHGKDGKETKETKVEEPSMWAQWGQALEDHWNSFSSEMWLEVQQLIRVRSVETPVALMMSPSQAYFAKENVKLRLLNARLALLSRNEVAFRNDLAAAQDSIAKFFDTRAKQTQTALTLLKAVQGSNLSIEMPNLGESLTAVRNYKAKP
ncbi:MAG: uroporphyrinogen-III C-methyltransferase [Burkholderiales bacterium]|nr:uroporphyrinogen-III C-methyltransferase [Burkholderiales bacterium]